MGWVSIDDDFKQKSLLLLIAPSSSDHHAVPAQCAADAMPPTRETPTPAAPETRAQSDTSAGRFFGRARRRAVPRAASMHATPVASHERQKTRLQSLPLTVVIQERANASERDSGVRWCVRAYQRRVGGRGDGRRAASASDKTRCLRDQVGLKATGGEKCENMKKG
jgi:hypothetical protein